MFFIGGERITWVDEIRLSPLHRRKLNLTFFRKFIKYFMYFRMKFATFLRFLSLLLYKKILID